MTNENNNYLEMSDDDFIKINPEDEPVSEDTNQPTETNTEEEKEVLDDKSGNEVEDKKEDEEDSDKNKEEKSEEDSENNEETNDSDTDSEEENNKKKSEDESKQVDKSTEDNKNKDTQEENKEEEPKVEMKPEDYQAFYTKVMTPFKANGKTITLNSPEEAIRLMQMGAGFGKKIQSLQPHLKTIRMLEKNELLDEGKLSYLIDLNQKKPEAIKQLIKDSGIDPLDLNLEDHVDYRPTNHSVSDNEFRFKEVLEEVTTLPQGRETIKEINTNWDQTSKQVLWESPELLTVIQSQVENGIYNTIKTEIDRQKLLGYIPHSMPFIEAYKTIGDSLYKQPQVQQPQAPIQQQPREIATRVAKPKPIVDNNEKAKAASPTPSSSRKSQGFINPLEMADDEFLKKFGDRL